MRHAEKAQQMYKAQNEQKLHKNKQLTNAFWLEINCFFNGPKVPKFFSVHILASEINANCPVCELSKAVSREFAPIKMQIFVHLY